MTITHLIAKLENALIYFVNQDVFLDCPTKPLYRKTFYIDGNCDLVRGWAKKWQ